MRTWMKLIAAVLLIPLATPALLHAADDTAIKKEDFQELIDKVDKLQSDMTANNLRGTRTAEELRVIREELQSIRKILERMENMAREQERNAERIARFGPSTSPPGGPPPAAPLPPTGTITVQNTYSAPATVRINGQPYEVGIGQTRAIYSVPTGPFQYSVEVEGFGMVEPPRTATLPATGYRINIVPRMPY
jgi:TolA-binding protein